MRTTKLLSKLLLGVFLVACCVFLTKAVFAQTKSPSGGGEPSILLEPAFLQLKMKEEFQVAVVINSDLPLVGADAKISFDPRVLEVVSIDDGDAFKNLPLKSVNKGAINITGIAEKKAEFSGTGTLATLSLKAKDAGDTNLIIAFSPGETSDSNLAQVPASDVLAKVEVGHYLIGTPMQRTTGAVKRFLIKIIPYLIFLIFLAIAGYLAYRWYKTQKSAGPEVFIPEEVPLDQPPPAEGSPGESPPVPPIPVAAPRVGEEGSGVSGQ